MNDWDFDPFLHGSTWVRADFHLHTRADREFQRPAATEEEGNGFVGHYVEALKSAGIRIGIIANHNKFDLGEFKALKSKARKEGIYLLPGVELSVNDGANGVHLIVVFSEAWIENGRDFINPFLTSTFQGKTPDQYQHENGRSSDSLMETLNKLENCSKDHKDFFVVFAHVDQRSGLWEEFAGGRIEELGQEKLFRRYTLGFQKARTDKRLKVREWLGDWYPAELEGCDAKSLEDIGKGRPCYIKLGAFSFEALKFALRDHSARIRRGPGVAEHSYVRSMRFEGGLLDGQQLHFSECLNCLIGIRGSGKSSILEVIRYVLDMPFGQKAQDTEYKKRLVPHLLGSGGKIIVEAVSRHGVVYEVHRILNEPPDVYIDGQLKPGVAIRETVIHKPLYFGQKDLSATGEGFEQDLVEKLMGERLREVRERIASQRSIVLDRIERVTAIKDSEDKRKDCQNQLNDLLHRLELYKKYGIEGKLKQQISFEQDLKRCETVDSLLERWSIALQAVLSEYEDELDSVTRYRSELNGAFFVEYFSIYAKVQEGVAALKKIVTDNRATGTELKARHTQLSAHKASLKEDFAIIERELAKQLQEQGGNAITTEEFKRLNLKRQQAEQMLAALDRQIGKTDESHNNLLVELTRLNDLWLEEYRLIQEGLRAINEGQTALKVEAEFKGDKPGMVNLLKELFRGSNLREAFYQDIVKAYRDFIAVYKDLGNAAALAGSNSQKFREYFIKYLRDLLVWQVPNTYHVIYHGKPLREHSLGQRTSAMIMFILSQNDNHVLMIDQPEDDLDNQTLYTEVIRLVRHLKPQMQFIFATHNANIPVLGDAEQIFACRYQANAMKVQVGSIDDPGIQRAIVDIMEGGEEAFDKRKEIYQLWKPRNSWK